MLINLSMASAVQQSAISCNSRSTTPTPQLFCSNRIIALLKISSTPPMPSLLRMNHGKRRTSGQMRDPEHHLSVMLPNLNTMKQNSLKVKSDRSKIWATPTQGTQQSSIAPTHSLVSLRKSLCALPSLIKSLVAFDSTNVKRLKIYLPTFASWLTPTMKSLYDASSIYLSAVSAIAHSKR